LLEKIVKFKHLNKKVENFAVYLAEIDPETKKTSNIHVKFSVYIFILLMTKKLNIY
jgi:hypothetical protein